MILIVLAMMVSAKAVSVSTAQDLHLMRLSSKARADTIENFDDGEIQLYSYPNEDMDPDAWSLDSLTTHNNSAFSLKLWGNTWKIESIVPVMLDTSDVWQVSAYIDTLAEIQGIGLRDTAHSLLYSFAGTQQLNTENWVTVSIFTGL